MSRMTSYKHSRIPTKLSQFDQYKLDTNFYDNCYKHTIPCGPSADLTHPQSPGGSRIEKWTSSKTLGEGAFGVVRLQKEEKGAVRAVKQISKKEMLWNTRELQALTKLKEYPQHFVELSGWFEDDKNIYLAMEYIQFGDLMSLIDKGDILENGARSITKQILQGLEIMHENKFCHRDLKPQNILVTSLSPITVKISDFGVTKQTSDGTELQTIVGTSGYIAPEILGFLDTENSTYTNSADIWSLGCLLYVMMTNQVPFQHNQELLRYIRGKVPFPALKLLERNVSPCAIAFIQSLIKPYPKDRLTAEEALEEPWLNLDGRDQEQMRSNTSTSTLGKVVPKDSQIENDKNVSGDTWSYISVTTLCHNTTHKDVKAVGKSCWKNTADTYGEHQILPSVTIKEFLAGAASAIDDGRSETILSLGAQRGHREGDKNPTLIAQGEIATLVDKLISSGWRECTTLQQVAQHEHGGTIKLLKDRVDTVAKGRKGAVAYLVLEGSVETLVEATNAIARSKNVVGITVEDNLGQKGFCITATSKRERATVLKTVERFADAARVKVRSKLRQMGCLAICMNRGKLASLFGKEKGQ